MTARPRPDPVTKILLFVDNFDQGGTQSQLVQLVNALRHDPTLEVHVGCINQRGPLLDVLRLPPHRVHEYHLTRFYNLHGLRQIGRLGRDIKMHRFHIVHALDFYANVMCAAAMVWIPRVKLVVSRRYELRSHRRVHRYGEWWCYRLANAVALNSTRIADRLMSRGLVAAHKAVVIPNGIDLARYAQIPNRRNGAADPARPVRVGVVARLAPVKGHSTLLRAIALLRPKWPRLVLVLIGDGELRRQLEHEADALRIRDRVRFVGTQLDVRPWLASLDVAVLPSHHEAFPNALLEYLAAGCPVVATAVGEVPNIVISGQHGLLVPPRQPNPLAAAIDRVLTDPDLRASLASAARRRAVRYDLARMIASTRELYRTINPIPTTGVTTPTHARLRPLRD